MVMFVQMPAIKLSLTLFLYIRLEKRLSLPATMRDLEMHQMDLFYLAIEAPLSKYRVRKDLGEYC